LPRVSGTKIARPARSNWMPSNKLEDLRVLYLENSPQVLQATQALLNSWHCDAIGCLTFDEALNAYRTQSIDVVMADYRLDGEQTGLDFLSLLGEQDSHASGILVTAEQDSNIKTAARDAGHFFLAKPVDPAALKNILARLSNIPNKRN
jgi:DNA-binding NtrC family response regulator